MSQLIHSLLPLILCIDLDLSVDELKASEGESSSRRGSQQIGPTAFVETFEAISTPELRSRSALQRHA